LEFSNFDFNTSSPELRPTSPRQRGDLCRDHNPGPEYFELADCGSFGGIFDLTSDGVVSNEPLSPLKELFELCANLVSDSDMLETHGKHTASRPGCQNWLEAAVQRTLSRTSRFSEVLEKLTSTETDTSQQTTANNDLDQIRLPPSTIYHAMPTQRISPSPETQQEDMPHLRGSSYLTHLPYKIPAESDTARKRRRVQDIPTASTLITTYVLIIRVWRYIFSHIYKSLNSLPPGQTIEYLMLPSLQLGGIHVRSNPCIQILVLLESSSSMLREVDTYLGIRAPLNSQSHYTDDEDVQSTLYMDPVCVLLRDAILLQEKSRESSESELEGLSLTRVMDEVRRQLIGRGGFNVAT
jgi:hypothetical protein